MTFYVIYFGVPVSKNTKPEEGYGSEEWITLTSHILKCFVLSSLDHQKGDPKRKQAASFGVTMFYQKH